MAMMSSGAHAAASAARPVAAVRRNALLIIDMQYDFCPPNGSLKVDGATDAIPVRVLMPIRSCGHDTRTRRGILSFIIASSRSCTRLPDHQSIATRMQI